MSKILTYRIWNIFAGVIIVLMVPRYLNENAQGYYFTFISILALQFLFELGISQAVTQIVSHEFGHLPQRHLISDPRNIHAAKLIFIKRFLKSWFKRICIAFVVVTWIAGTAYFVSFSKSTTVAWILPWTVMVLATAVNLFVTAQFAIIEGSGETGRVAMIRLIQSILGHAVMIIIMLCDGQLWCIVAVPLTSCIFSAAYLAATQNPVRGIPNSSLVHGEENRWRSELLGLQWRVALAWVGGYFASQSLIPIIFALQGAGEAGRIGIAMQIFMTLQTLGMSWVNAKSPIFGHLIARGEFSALRSLFVKSTTYAALTTLTASSSAALCIYAIASTYPTLAGQLPSAQLCLTLVVTTTVSTLIYSQAAYMRAHKTEPLVASSLVIGFLTVLSAYYAAQVSSSLVITFYAAITICINAPWTYLLYRQYRMINSAGENVCAK